MVSGAATLIAREEELDRALQALRFSGGVLITGEAGVGKTVLAAAAARRLPGPPVASVVATAASRTIPLGVLSGLLPADLATIHPALVAQHVDTRLRELSRTGPRSAAAPVLAVDDAHLLDAQSAAVVLSLVGASSVRLLATMRTGATPSDAVTALWKERLVERLDLQPLDPTATAGLLEAVLEGPVASSAVQTLWSISNGNPFYLTELARFGVERGQWRRDADLWWWVGGRDVPPRLTELLSRRIDALDGRAREAVDVLALGEPLPYETLAAVVGEDAILELDRAGIVIGDEADGVLLLRFSHPLLQAVAEREVSTARRRALARRLRAAPADHVDVVRRASWEDAAGDEPNVDLLLAAADAVLLNDAAAAVRLAARARQVDPTVRSSLALSAALSESGQAALARSTLEEAHLLAVSLPDRLALASEDFSLALWAERDPERARRVVERVRTEAGDAARTHLLGSEAVLGLFTGRCAEVIPVATELLADDPDPSSRVRALTCLTGALAFADRGAEAIAAGQQLLDALAATRVSATRTGLAYALIAVTGVLYGVEYRLPRAVGPLGRWPGEPDRLSRTSSAQPPDPQSSALGWPLLVGLRRHFLGDLAGAVEPLREAYVQQQAGEGLFRSETTAELIVVLCELGRGEEAAAVLAAHPPDGVAIIPGLPAWAEAAVEGASGRRASAARSAIAAAREAAGRGAAAMAMNFLTDAGRWGEPGEAAAALPTLGLALDTPLQQVRAADITARAQRDPGLLVAAAEAQLAAGFLRHAQELAELAAARDRANRESRRIAAVLRVVGERLGEQAAGGTPVAGRLTARETEVARLASRGLSDREIADRLVLSVRTVHSHLASVYRKLGISSRAELTDQR